MQQHLTEYARRIWTLWGPRKGVASPGRYVHRQPSRADDVTAGAGADRRCTRMDVYLHWAYKVLSWQDPVLTWCTLGGIHVIFWCIVHFEVRLFGFLFSLLLCAFLTDAYFERNGVKQKGSNEIDTMRQYGEYVREAVRFMLKLRRESPSLFCVTMSITFITSSMMARSVTGHFLAYMSILGIFFTPLIATQIPPEFIARAKRLIQDVVTKEGLVAESELIPYIKDFVERDVDQDSVVTDKTADSVANSLISGITSMPSHMDADCGSLDNGGEIEEDDLLPTTEPESARLRRKQRRLQAAATGLPYDSDDSDTASLSSRSSIGGTHMLASEEVANAHSHLPFNTQHFRRSASGSHSSSDSDEFERHYTAGLAFPADALDSSGRNVAGTADWDGGSALGSELIRRLESFVPAAASHLLYQAASTFQQPIRPSSNSRVDDRTETSGLRRRQRRSDSDSDFEIVDAEDDGDDLTT